MIRLSRNSESLTLLEGKNQFSPPLKIFSLPPPWTLLPHPDYVPGQNYSVLKSSGLGVNFRARIFFLFGFIQTRSNA
jgi:hypothetical protein